MIAQKGRCYYCDLPMWDEALAPDPDGSSKMKAQKILRCTAEHLHPQSEGGRNVADNIVAACWYCNTRRHRRKRALSPKAYRLHVQKRMAEDRWLKLSEVGV